MPRLELVCSHWVSRKQLSGMQVGGRGSATGDEGVQREQGLDGSPKARCGWPAEEIRVPVWAGVLGGAGFHVERITERLSTTFLYICLQ